MLIKNTNNYDVNIVLGKAQYHINPKETIVVKPYSNPLLPSGVVVVTKEPKVSVIVSKGGLKTSKRPSTTKRRNTRNDIEKY